jgi:hypothetical protein
MKRIIIGMVWIIPFIGFAQATLDIENGYQFLEEQATLVCENTYLKDMYECPCFGKLYASTVQSGKIPTDPDSHLRNYRGVLKSAGEQGVSIYIVNGSIKLTTEVNTSELEASGMQFKRDYVGPMDAVQLLDALEQGYGGQWFLDPKHILITGDMGYDFSECEK